MSRCTMVQTPEPTWQVLICIQASQSLCSRRRDMSQKERRRVRKINHFSQAKHFCGQSPQQNQLNLCRQRSRHVQSWKRNYVECEFLIMCRSFFLIIEANWGFELAKASEVLVIWASTFCAERLISQLSKQREKKQCWVRNVWSDVQFFKHKLKANDLAWCTLYVIYFYE